MTKSLANGKQEEEINEAAQNLGFVYNITDHQLGGTVTALCI